jgi:2-polyprenyl-3-methyl-5-hydroxy-6-metoxy-1,4-benzoquinol methylase
MAPANLRILSELPSDHPGFNIADQGALQALSEAEARHFWFRTRNHFISKRLTHLGCVPPARVLELGCGGGAVCAHLANRGFEVTGVDGHRARVLEAARRVPTGSFFVCDLANGTGPFREGGFDAVGLFDVIEHLSKPRDALLAALSCARLGGLVVGTVPALMSLWSEADALAGHRLRFEQPPLSQLLYSIPGASVVEICPFNRALVPLLFLQRRLFPKRRSAISAGIYLKVPPAALNRTFGALLRLEQLLGLVLDRLRLPGASLWFALRKGEPKSTPEPSDLS